MLQYFQVTNHLGESLKLELRSPERSGLFIKNIDGLGPSKVTVNTSESISHDGAFFDSSRVNERNIVLDLGYYWPGIEDFETVRLKSYKYFPPNKELIFEIKTDTRLVYATGYVESNEPNIFSNNTSIVLSLLCPDAFFYGLDTIATLFNGVDPAFEFPFEDTSTTDPTLMFGSIFTDTIKSIVYTGDLETGFIIYINLIGAVTGLTLSNLSLGQSMLISSSKIATMLGAGMQAGDQIIVSSVKGNKFVYLIRGGNTYNILNALNAGSEWLTLDRGDNLISYTAATGITNVQMITEHQIVYGGV